MSGSKQSPSCCCCCCFSLKETETNMTAGIPCIKKVGVGDLLSRMSGKNSSRYRANAPRTFFFFTLPKRLQRWYREALDNISETLFTFSGKAGEGVFENWPMTDCSEWVNQYHLEVFQPPVHRELAELNGWGWPCLPHFPSWKYLYLLKFEKPAKPTAAGSFVDLRRPGQWLFKTCSLFEYRKRPRESQL